MSYQIGGISSLFSSKSVDNSLKLVSKEFKLKTNEKSKTKTVSTSDNLSTKQNKTSKEHETILPKKVKKPRHNRPQSTTDSDIKKRKSEDASNDPKPKKSKSEIMSNDNNDGNQSEDSGINQENEITEDTAETQEVREEDPEENEKTIFVGNWPINKQKKHLKRYFIRYGEIESVRFRSIPISDIRVSRKVTAITKQFHPNRTSTNAYVKFKTKESANKAVKANGTCIDNHHLRVSISNAAEFDLNKSIFLGNLDFQTEEDDLWKLFEGCSDIDSVRIVRDKKTGISKGIGYVNFVSRDGVELALKMDGTTLKNREIRVKRIDGKSKKKKEKEDKKLTNTEACERRIRVKKNKDFQGKKFTQKKKKKSGKINKKSKVSFKPIN